MENYSSAEPTTRTFAALRIIGKLLAPSDITARLRINPSENKYAGEPRGRSGHWPHGYWILSSEEHVDSPDLEVHLVWLIDMIEPAMLELQTIQGEGVMSDVFCFWETSLEQGAIRLTPETLRRLGKLNLALDVDIYFAS